MVNNWELYGQRNVHCCDRVVVWVGLAATRTRSLGPDRPLEAETALGES